MRNVTGHVLAAAASVPVLAVLPFVALRLSWALSGMLGETAGVGECCGTPGRPTASGGILANPFEPALLLGLALVVVGSAAAEAGRRKHLGAWWAVPVLVPVSTGAVLALAAWHGLPEGLSGTVPIVIGITAAACMALLQATYTGVLWVLRVRNDAV